MHPLSFFFLPGDYFKCVLLSVRCQNSLFVYCAGLICHKAEYNWCENVQIFCKNMRFLISRVKEQKWFVYKPKSAPSAIHSE